MVLLDPGTPATSREIFSEDADGEDSNPKSLGYKLLSAPAIELESSVKGEGGILPEFVYRNTFSYIWP